MADRDCFEGRIIRGIAGFYYVHVNGRGVFECKAKGVFRNKSEKPLVGDMVLLREIKDTEKENVGHIDRILPRTSELIRPAVANVDQALVIFAAADPEPNLNLLDRFLCEMERQSVSSVVCFNKRDLISDERADELRSIYEKAGYKVLMTSAIEGELSSVIKLLDGKVTTVAGPSGAGKSSLVNHLQGSMQMETGEISKKLGRGKHTTRRAELIPVDGLDDSFIVDTPGFSSIYVMEDDPLEVQNLFPEIGKWEPQCRFQGCAHIHEPDCGVKAALERGEISAQRYESYRSFYEEIKGRAKDYSKSPRSGR